jgi:hypothetical protein
MSVFIAAVIAPCTTITPVFCIISTFHSLGIIANSPQGYIIIYLTRSELYAPDIQDERMAERSRMRGGFRNVILQSEERDDVNILLNAFSSNRVTAAGD